MANIPFVSADIEEDQMGTVCCSARTRRDAAEKKKNNEEQEEGLNMVVRSEKLLSSALSSTRTDAATPTGSREAKQKWQPPSEDPPTTISRLSDDVLLLVFSYLDFVNLRLAGRVCRKWYTLTRDFTFNRHVDLRNIELSPKQLELFVNAGTMPCMESLSVLGSPNWLWLTNIAPSTISILSKRCPRLLHLKIENFAFRSIPRFRLCKFPLTLEVLRIRGCIVDCHELFEMEPGQTVMLERLRVLDIGLCFFSVDGQVKPFPKLPHLNELFLEGCPFIDSLQYLTNLLSKCPMLTVLDVEATYIVQNALCLIGIYCTNIKYLYIGCTSLNDTVIFNLPARTFLNLRGICIMQTAVTYDGLSQLLQSLPSLTHVRCDLRYLPQETFSRIEAQALSPNRSRIHFEVASLRFQSAVFRSDGCGHATDHNWHDAEHRFDRPHLNNAILSL